MFTLGEFREKTKDLPDDTPVAVASDGYYQRSGVTFSVIQESKHFYDDSSDLTIIPVVQIALPDLET